MEDHKNSLYAYFGEIGLFDDNIPGHSFYQIGLLDSIAKHFNVNKFDFYNYLDVERGDDEGPYFLDDRIGTISATFANSLINQYRVSYNAVLTAITHKMYDKLFLKARFRNLSTLDKKTKDAYRFESIIKYAIAAGYNPHDIIIIDTDLAMTERFKDRLNRLGVQIVIPSIDFPGIGQRYLTMCMESHKDALSSKSNNIMYYGNLDFSNYKDGHSKNPIIFDIIKDVNNIELFDLTSFRAIVAAKDSPIIRDFLFNKDMHSIDFIPRTNRADIWKALVKSLVSINVSKDLYLKKGFVPARVYESIIAGTIPVSYKKGQLNSMSFETVEDFYEIVSFLHECTPSEYYTILDTMARSLI